MERVECLETMVEGADEGLLLLAASGEVIAANSRALRLLDLRRDAVIGSRISVLSRARDWPWSVAADAVVTHRAVSALHTRDGAKLLVTGKPLVGPADAPHGVVVTIQDVSELSRAMTSLDDSRRRSDDYRRELRGAEARERHADVVIGDSAIMRAVRGLAMKYAALDSPVLLLGETGTGKGVFSRLIHDASARATGPFVELNCGAIPEGVIEAELFGYAPGAFTGAHTRGKTGLVELAHGGTLLLDEIGDLPLGLQVKLLRFLDDGRIWPVGAVRSRQPDVRVLAATNRDLEVLIAGGAFRRDLYYRLNVLTLRLPALRDRRDDIAKLIGMMLERLAPRLRRHVVMAPAAMAVLARREFPGNVRELWNIVERLAVSSERDVLDTADLSLESMAPPVAEGPGGTEPRTLRRALQDVEAAILRETLARCGSQSRAASHLGVSQATVARRAKRYGLSR
jgi:transcriptional regulator with PAS, ATPase and Fis domain